MLGLTFVWWMLHHRAWHEAESMTGSANEWDPPLLPLLLAANILVKMITRVVITLVLVTAVISTRLRFSAHSRVGIDSLSDLCELMILSTVNMKISVRRRGCHEGRWWWGILSARWSDYTSRQDLMTWFDDKNCRDTSPRKNETTTQLHSSAKVQRSKIFQLLGNLLNCCLLRQSHLYL